MKLREFMTGLIAPKQRAIEPGASKEPIPSGRVSIDSGLETTVFNSTLAVTPPTDHESFWRLNNLDYRTLGQMSPRELLDMLADLSPEISYAIWQFNRMCNPGYEYKVYRLVGDNVISGVGTKAVDALVNRMRKQYGSFDIVVGRYFMGAYMRGAVAGELVFGPDGRTAVDLVAPDPYSVNFKRKKDPERGWVWIPGQWQDGKFVELDIPTFAYLPIDPAPASPYGRSLASPALFTAIFMLSLYHDIKRVIMQQGYKRMDISLDTDAAIDSFNADNQGYASLGEYVRAAIASIKSTYGALQPDDAFIHTNIFELKPPAGTIDSDSIGAIDKIMERLEKTITRALKMNGVVLDTSNNTNESDANRKWEIFSAGVKSIQHHVENMLEEFFQLALRAQGIQARVQFRFAELRASEMFRDEQTRQLRIQNGRAEYESGFSSQDEAANKTVGHDADKPEPVVLASGFPVQPVQDNSSGNELILPNEDIERKTHIDNNEKEGIVWKVKQ